MKLKKNDNAVLIRNRPLSFIVLDLIGFNAVIDVLNSHLPEQYPEIFNYIFDRIEPFLKELDKENMEEIFNDIISLNNEFDRDITNEYLEKENGNYEVFITPVSRLKKLIEKQMSNEDVNWVNYFYVLSLSLIAGVNSPGPVVEYIIEGNHESKLVNRNNMAGELAVYAMEAVDYAELLQFKIGEKTKLSRQNQKSANMRLADIRELESKMCFEYFEGDYRKHSKREAARRLLEIFQEDINSTKLKPSEHWRRVTEWVTKWEKELSSR